MSNLTLESELVSLLGAEFGISSERVRQILGEVVKRAAGPSPNRARGTVEKERGMGIVLPVGVMCG